jgi:hypothetical protein
MGGSNDFDNLALACHRCNERRYNFTTGMDPETEQEVSLFNPRQQRWIDCFLWAAGGTIIVGRNPTGRATCNRLDLNDQFHDDAFIQQARQYWVEAGWHPPPEDFAALL